MNLLVFFLIVLFVKHSIIRLEKRKENDTKKAILF